MKNIEKYIDHTLLKPDATEAAIGKVWQQKPLNMALKAFA